MHTYQVSQYLARQGYSLLTLNNEQGEHFSRRFRRSPAGLKALIAEADILYFRVDGRVGWEIIPSLPGFWQIDKPIIWEINATLEELQVLPEPRRWRDRLGGWLRSISARRADLALCVSEPLVHYAQDLGISQTILVPNGSEPTLFSPELHDAKTFPGLEGCFRVLWAGSTAYSWHDFQTVLACARELESLDPEINFAVIGHPPDLPPEQIPTNVHFYPPVPYLEVPRWFASAHVGLCLYRDITWSKYGFFFSPLKLFDYAASGLPVIYTALPELQRVAQPFGLPVAIGDGQHLSQQILQLKADPALYQHLATSARQTVLDYYNWNRVGMQTESALLTASRK